MKKISLLFALTVIALAFAPAASVKAAELSTGNMITLEKEQKNPLIFSDTAKVKNDVKGDLTVFSGNIEVTGRVESSAYLFGGTINLKSPEIGNRLVVGGGEVTVSSHIKGDLIIFGGNVSIEKPNIVDGDIYIYGGNVYLRGQVGSSVNAGGGKVIFEDALIEKNASIRSDQISASEQSRVNGEFVYYAKKPLSFPAEFNKNPEFNTSRGTKSGTSSSIVGGLIMLMFLSVILIFFQRGRLEGLVSTTYSKIGLKILTGAIITIGLPIISIILLISYVGVLAGIALIALYITAYIIAYAYGAIFAGGVLVKWFGKSKDFKIDWPSAVFGSISVSVLSLIPLIGPIVVFGLMLLGLAMVYDQITNAIKAK